MRGFGPLHAGVSPYDGPSGNVSLAWSFYTHGEIESSPAIGTDGTVYIGSNDNNVRLGGGAG